MLSRSSGRRGVGVPGGVGVHRWARGRRRAPAGPSRRMPLPGGPRPPGLLGAVLPRAGTRAPPGAARQAEPQADRSKVTWGAARGTWSRRVRMGLLTSSARLGHYPCLLRGRSRLGKQARSSGRPHRRAPGEGSIVRYRGRWRVRVRWHGTEGTWYAPSHQAAVLKLREALDLRDGGMALNATPGRMPLDAWFDEWLSQAALTRPRTESFYRAKLQLLRPLIGHIRLSELSPREIRLALAELSQSGAVRDDGPARVPHPLHGTLCGGARASHPAESGRRDRCSAALALHGPYTDGRAGAAPA